MVTTNQWVRKALTNGWVMGWWMVYGMSVLTRAVCTTIREYDNCGVIIPSPSVATEIKLFLLRLDQEDYKPNGYPDNSLFGSAFVSAVTTRSISRSTGTCWDVDETAELFQHVFSSDPHQCVMWSNFQKNSLHAIYRSLIGLFSFQPAKNRDFNSVYCQL